MNKENISFVKFTEYLNNKEPYKAFRCFADFLDEAEKKGGSPEELSPCLFKGLTSLCYCENALTDSEYLRLISLFYKLHRPPKVNKLSVKNPRLFKTLRVGILSHNLVVNPSGIFAMSLFKTPLNHPQALYYIYDTRANNKGYIIDCIKKGAAKYESLHGSSPQELMDAILKDELDILIDLDGLSKGTKINLMAARLAPVQITWIGWPSTSAMPNVDYQIVDKITDPPGFSEKFYTERLLYLDRCFLCYPYEGQDAEGKAIPFVKNGYVTFGAMMNMEKLSDTCLRLWKKILDRTPSSRLYMQSENLKCEEDREALCKRLESFGYDLSRVDIFLRAEYIEYFNSYDKIDIVLDTYPFNGATTTCDALFKGAPLINLCGSRHWERVGRSMLSQVGLEDLSADSEEEYIEKAVALAENKERLAELRGGLASVFKGSPLNDCLAFKIELEHRLREAYIENLEDKTEAKAPEEASVLMDEVLNSIFHLQYMLKTKKPAYFTLGLAECAALQLALCSTLAKRNKGLKEAENILRAYKKSIYMLNKSPTDTELEDIFKLQLRLLNSLF